MARKKIDRSRNCVICKEVFEPRNDLQRACSKECSKVLEKRSRSIEIDMVCAICNSTFKKKRYARRNYCSTDCSRYAGILRSRRTSELHRRPAKLAMPVTVKEQPAKLVSHDPKIQDAIDAYLARGGKVTRLKPGVPAVNYLEDLNEGPAEFEDELRLVT